MSFSKEPFTVAIIGGGLAGLTLSIGLTRNGINHQIYESAKQFSEIGAGITMVPNAISALGLIDPKLREAFDKCSTRNETPEWKNSFMAQRYGMQSNNEVSFGDIITKVDCYSLLDAGRSSVHRAHFLEELLKIVPPGIANFGKLVVDIKQDAGGVYIFSADGTNARASIAVCCDGIRSLGRKIVLGPGSKNIAPSYAGTYAYRNLLPRAVAEKYIDAGNGNIYCGQGGYIIMYPVDHGNLINMVAMHRPSEHEWRHDEWQLPTSREDMMKDFEGWGEPIIELLNYVKSTDRWALFDSPDADTFCRGRICLLGDSAHATTPHQGSGAGMGFEGAYVLSQLLGQMRDPRRVEEVLKAYDAVRRPRTQKIVKTSRDAGKLYNFVLPGVGSDLKKMNEVLKDWHEWIWKIDLPGQVREAQGMLEKGSKLYCIELEGR